MKPRIDCSNTGRSLIGLAIAMTLTTNCWTQDLVQGDWSFKNGLPCDRVSCDSCRPSDLCNQNEWSKRGSIGTLLRWSANPTSGKIAQPNEGPLVSDRPDFTEASSVVGLGVLQIESGYTYTFDNDGTTRSIGHTYPETLVRYGVIANWLEFRFGTSYSEERVNQTRFAGAEDLYLGFKFGLTAQEGWRPEMALVPQMTVPSGGRDPTAGEVLAGLNWLYGWDLNDKISTAGSTQFNKARDDDTARHYTEWAQSWTIGYSLAERLGGYTEYFGLYPNGADSVRTQHYFNGGITYSFTDDIQWDIRAGKGLNSASDDYFLGTGLVLRFR